eukprot:scaffold14964_cov146-Isochrysis_galbana.AAC.3
MENTLLSSGDSAEHKQTTNSPGLWAVRAGHTPRSPSPFPPRPVSLFRRLCGGMFPKLRALHQPRVWFLKA